MIYYILHYIIIIIIQCLTRLSDEFPSTLRFLRNFQKLSIKNITKLGNFPLSDDFFRFFCHLDAPGTVYHFGLFTLLFGFTAYNNDAVFYRRDQTSVQNLTP